MDSRLTLAFLVPALGAALGSTAAAQTILRTHQGDLADDRMGVAVASAGDVNNDGRPDYIVGAPEDGFVFNLREGYARVYSGVNGSTLFTINGSALADSLGVAVDGAGHVNADAFGDVVVGSPYAGGSQNGVVRVVSGQSPNATLWTFTGAANEQMGRAVAGAGDVNNDGRDDVIVGAPMASPAGASSGFARIYSGLTGGILRTFTGTATGHRVGVSVDGVGDLNNDGFDEVIVGSVGVGATVYSGINGAPLFATFTSASADDVYGISVAGVGDVNGDNVPDFAIGATQDGSIFTQGPGYVQLRSGTNGALIRTLNGVGNSDRFGVDVAGVGDLDGDNKDEVIVGADQASLEAPGYAKVFSGQTGLALHTFLGDANNDTFGVSVDGIGDGDNDGKAEFLIGAPVAAPGGQLNRGIARVWETNIGSGCASPTNFCVLSPNSAGPGAQIGSAGTVSVAANDLTLITTGLPPHPVGIYFYGATQVQTAFGNGFQCAGGAQVFRIGSTVATAGVATLPLNFNQAPMNGGAGQITSGSTWKFQFWFRDVNGGGAEFNLSNGLSVTFCP